MKKSISLLLVLALLCAFLPTLALPVAATEGDPVAAAKDGDTVTLDGVDYTVLKDPATLVSTVTGNMKGNYILGCDMDMGGKEYKTKALFGNSGFEGIFNGNGHSLTGFSVKNSHDNSALVFAYLTSSKSRCPQSDRWRTGHSALPDPDRNLNGNARRSDRKKSGKRLHD